MAGGVPTSVPTTSTAEVAIVAALEIKPATMDDAFALGGNCFADIVAQTRRVIQPTAASVFGAASGGWCAKAGSACPRARWGGRAAMDNASTWNRARFTAERAACGAWRGCTASMEAASAPRENCFAAMFASSQRRTRPTVENAEFSALPTKNACRVSVFVLLG